ncbi:hypothetical protein FXO37_10016 [Capsicum annuum]|nr:hypothetical protein FXO37_10016 [Capsicum annuum]
MQGRAAYNTPLWWSPFPNTAHSNSFCAPDCPFYCCCDGLCFIGIWSDLDERKQPPILLLWNPSTRESIKLPTRYPESPSEKYLYGLGYDSTSHDYKITRIDAFEECDDGLPDEILAIKSASQKKTSEYAESPSEKYLYGLGYDSTSHDYKITRIDAFEECDDGLPDEILAIKSASRRKTSEYAGGICAIQTRA